MNSLAQEFEAARAAVIEAGERLATIREKMRAAGLDASARSSVRVATPSARLDVAQVETFLAVASAGPRGVKWTPALHPTEVLALRDAGVVEEVTPDRWALAPGVRLEAVTIA